jgi:plasmid stabilization system protein ParE
MPQGDKSAYTDKQKRKAEHIEEGYEDRGVSEKEAERRAWATVNNESGGGKKSGSGRGHAENHASSEKGGHKGGAPRHREQKKSVPLPPKRPPLPVNAMDTRLIIRPVRCHRRWRLAVRRIPYA